MSAAVTMKAVLYPDLRALLENELLTDEDSEAAALMQELAHAKEDHKVSRGEFLRMCMWKSPRPKNHYEKNTDSDIQETFTKVFGTKSEQRRITLLTDLYGVEIPTASAILTLTDPDNYGVIDIRVWQLLYALKSVTSKPGGQGFTFKNWFHFLSKLRFFAKEFTVPVRRIERSLFEYQKRLQVGTLYRA